MENALFRINSSRLRMSNFVCLLRSLFKTCDMTRPLNMESVANLYITLLDIR
jgi:hypothetical protein